MGDRVDDPLLDALRGGAVTLEINDGEVEQKLCLLLLNLLLADGLDEVLHDHFKDLLHVIVSKEASELIEIEGVFHEVQCSLVDVFVFSSVEHVQQK